MMIARYSSLCVGFFVTCSTLWASSYGLFLTRSGDRLDANLTRIQNKEPLALEAREFEEELQVQPGHSRFWLTRNKAPKKIDAGNDLVTLRSGQVLRGKLLEMDAEQLTLQMYWGQAVVLSRKNIASIEPGKAGMQVQLEAKQWKTSQNGGRQNTEHNWLVEPWGLVNLNPHQRRVNRTYKGEFRHCILEAELSFASDPQWYLLMVSDTTESTNRRPMSLQYNARSKNISLHGMGIMSMRQTVEMPEHLKKAKQHRITLYLDPVRKENTLYMNGVVIHRWASADPNQLPGWTNPNVTLDFREPNPVVVQRLGIRQVEQFLAPAQVEAEGTRLRFFNGDELPAEVTSLKDGKLNLDLGGSPLALDLTQVGQVQFQSASKRTPNSSAKVYVHGNLPPFHATSLKMDEEVLTLSLHGVSKPLQIPKNVLGAIDWPSKQEQGVAEDQWMVLLDRKQELSGNLLSISDEALKIQPDWSQSPVTVPSSRLISASRKLSGKMENPTSMVMLQDGSFFPGQLIGLADGRIQLETESWGIHDVEPEHIRMLSSSDSRKAAWFLGLDQVELASHRRVSRMRAGKDIHDPVGNSSSSGARVNQRIPTKTERYVMRVRLDKATQITGYFQLQRYSHNNKRYGISLRLTPEDVHVQVGREKSRVIKRPKSGMLSELEITMDKKKRQVSMRIDSEDLGVVAEWRDGEIFHERGKTVQMYINGMGAVPAYAQVLPWKDEAELQAFRTKGVILGSWQGDRYLGEDWFSSLLPEEGAEGKAPRITALLSKEDPELSGAERTGPVLYLGLRLARIQSSAMSLTEEGIWQVQHPAFPEGFQLEKDVVSELMWKSGTPNQMPSRWPGRNPNFLRAR